ncbi:MAG: glutamate racemase [Deltaproteobacteria bacterium]|jgi:glutamate racemase|nr:glutamate racemase [Deltaproteobacteria bacterium]
MNAALSDDSDRPIGVFDSGMGGLTVLSALMARLPHEDMLYLGDTARLPYGTKSRRTVARYALQAAEKLVSMRVKALVIACNTATAAALDEVRAAWPQLSVLGVVEPGAAAACAATRNNRIAVIATESTIRGGAYQRAIQAIRPDSSVIGQSCSLFVPLAEEGWMDGPIVEAVAKRYLEPLFMSGASGGQSGAADGQPDAPNKPDIPQPDCLVLGCTHFPTLTATIAKVLGDLSVGQVTIVDSAATTAQAVKNKLRELDLLNRQSQPGQARFMTTDDEARFARIGSLFLGRQLEAGQVELVNL